MSEPWVHFEDEHLLVVEKPPGVNTHRSDVHAQDGMYEWVQRQRPGMSLSILHRLDKATSGLLVFGVSGEANRSLSAQFENRTVTKRYELLVERGSRSSALRCDEPIDGSPASTDFERALDGRAAHRYVATPHTGRTHQVRIHAAGLGMPILGDAEHGGAEAPRLFLHAAGLGFDHPTTGRLHLTSERPASFDRVATSRPDWSMAPLAVSVALEARARIFDAGDTDCYLWIDRHHDGFPDVRVERLGERALVLDYTTSRVDREMVEALEATAGLRGVFVQHRPKGGGGGLPQLATGDPASAFEVTELGLRYLIDLEASATSSGLFLDQRETRRELMQMDLSGRTVLNTFAHTGALSVASASAGAEVLTLDLSKRYLEWARDNLRANDIDPEDHDFVYGDAIGWMERFAKKGRVFDVVLVDPPSSSTGRKGGRRWVADRDMHGLVHRAAEVCAPGGSLYLSTNLRRMAWGGFLDHIDRGLVAARRTGSIETRTLPIDHRSGPGDPPYLKAAWVTLDG